MLVCSVECMYTVYQIVQLFATGVLLTFLADEFAYGSGNKFLTSVGGFMGDYNRAGFFATAFDAVIGWTNAGTGASLSCIAF